MNVTREPSGASWSRSDERPPRTGDRTASAWGAAACACKQQVAVEERPPPMPNGAAQSETPAGTPASRTEPSSSLDANRLLINRSVDSTGWWSFDDLHPAVVVGVPGASGAARTSPVVWSSVFPMKWNPFCGPKIFSVDSQRVPASVDSL